MTIFHYHNNSNNTKIIEIYIYNIILDLWSILWDIAVATGMGSVV